MDRLKNFLKNNPLGRWFIPTTLLILALIIIGSRAGWFPGPQTKPQADKDVPPIPDVINKGEGVEPEILVYMHETGNTKSMPIETYIQGVVAAEMETDWLENALAAQAILARTFTLQKIAEKNKLENRNAHASTDKEEFQAYDASKINDRVKKAVEKTRGKVLIYDGDYIRAWFHAYSGGMTATAKEGLDFTEAPTPYIQPVNDSAFDEKIPQNVRLWTASFPLTKVRAAVNQATGKDPGPINSLEIAEKTKSGRAATIRVNNTIIKGNALRKAMDSTIFKSTLLTDIKIADDKATFSGKGYGHGVGMSQWGARVLADQGKTPEQIALYYFRNCKIADLW